MGFWVLLSKLLDKMELKDRMSKVNELSTLVRGAEVSEMNVVFNEMNKLTSAQEN